MKDDLYEEFVRESEWFDHLGGWRRRPLNGVVVEIANLGDSRFQTIINPAKSTEHYVQEAKRCKTSAEAKEFAYECSRQFLQAKRADGPPAKCEMNPT